MPSPDPIQLIRDDLIARILRSRGGQRLLKMSELEVQQFLSSAESALTIQSAGAAVQEVFAQARARVQLDCDLVLEGGGPPSAVGFAGAVNVLEERGYVFHKCAGSSAGALVAALLAAGIPSPTLREVLLFADYPRFRLPGSRLWWVGRSRRYYSVDYLKAWVQDLLADMHVRTFGDLRFAGPGDAAGPLATHPYRLVVGAFDLTLGRPVQLPGDYPRYGLDPDEQSVADAVAAALALTEMFKPFRLKYAGGATDLAAVSNSDLVGVFDRTDGRRPSWPTFGLRIVRASEQHGARWTEDSEVSQDFWPRRVEIAGDVRTDVKSFDRDRARMIIIPSQVRPTDFDTSSAQAERLYENGRLAAEQFLRNWDFSKYVDSHDLD